MRPTYPVDIMLKKTRERSKEEKFFEYDSLAPQAVRPKTSTSMIPQIRNIVSQSKNRLAMLGRLEIAVLKSWLSALFFCTLQERTQQNFVSKAWCRSNARRKDSSLTA